MTPDRIRQLLADAGYTTGDIAAADAQVRVHPERRPGTRVLVATGDEETADHVAEVLAGHGVRTERVAPTVTRNLWALR